MTSKGKSQKRGEKTSTFTELEVILSQEREREREKQHEENLRIASVQNKFREEYQSMNKKTLGGPVFKIY
jgi:hypothetical protein